MSKPGDRSLSINGYKDLSKLPEATTMLSGAFEEVYLMDSSPNMYPLFKFDDSSTSITGDMDVCQGEVFM